MIEVRDFRMNEAVAYSATLLHQEKSRVRNKLTENPKRQLSERLFQMPVLINFAVPMMFELRPFLDLAVILEVDVTLMSINGKHNCDLAIESGRPHGVDRSGKAGRLDAQPLTGCIT